MLNTTSCTNTEETIPTGGNPLQVSVTSTTPSTRTLVESPLLPNDATMGVTLVATNGSTYDTDENGKYNNMLYSTTDGETFTTTSAPLLTYNEAKAAAYYPYSSTATDVTAIPVSTASQTDYMYSGWYTGLDESNPQAKFNMKHALAAVRLLIQKDADYTPVATLTAVKAQSDAFYASATLDATSDNGTLSGLTGAGATVQNTSLNQVLSTAATIVDFLVVPGTSAADITFTATIGGKDYVAKAENVTLQQGAIHSYTLTLTPQGMSVTNTTVQPWTTINKGSLTLEKYVLTWDNAPNGVYAVKKEGDNLIPVTYENIDINNTDQYIAIALIANDVVDTEGNPNPQRLMIEKYEYNNDAWGGYMTLEIDYDSTMDENVYYSLIVEGYQGGKISGSFNPSEMPNEFSASIKISTDYTTWTSGALSDFDGKSNTVSILAKKDRARLVGYVLSTFNSDSSQNQGLIDWYIPSVGQMALMYINLDKINETLEKINGSIISSDYYWTSTKCSGMEHWCFAFNDYGYTSMLNCEDTYQYFRFVRDINH